jgi:ABC-type transport system involved in multi-copper enzyme maturation permease subunit
MTITNETLLLAFLLVLIQFLAALPWIVSFSSSPGQPSLLGGLFRSDPRARARLIANLGAPCLVVLALVTFGIAGLYFVDRSYLETFGQLYTFVLQIQLVIDFFVFFFPVILSFWPKGGAVAQAAFREGVRQPMFWLLTGVGWLAMSVAPFVPYFTFGEDHIFVKDLGFDTILLVATLFGALAAGTSISEEIEGRTAVTLMSKPVSRRQFVLGKFLGILLGAMLMYGILGAYFQGIILFKAYYDRLDPVPNPTWIVATLEYLGQSTDISGNKEFLIGVGLWIDNGLETLPGLLLTFCQAMVLLAISVTLAVRLPMVVNLCTVLAIYFFAHLTPVLVDIGKKTLQDNPGSPVGTILSFMSGVLNTILPALSFFRYSAAQMGDNPLPLIPFYTYVASVAGYAVLYTLIVLLVGLILFEDRDLA